MAKIDALAVMDHLAYALQHSQKAVAQINEARAAVAELIEAVIHLRSCSGDEGSDDGSVADLRLDAAKRRVDEALENCGVKA